MREIDTNSPGFSKYTTLIVSDLNRISVE